MIQSAELPLHQSVPSNELLSPHQVGQYLRQGFLVVDSPRIEQQELAHCRNVLMRLIEQGVGRKEGRNFDLSARSGGNDTISPQMVRPSLYAAELAELRCRKIGLAFAKQLLGPEAHFALDNTIYKPSIQGGPTPWHQDEAYNDPRSYQEQISVWIALTDTTIDSSPMRYIPGSHKLGILRHRLHGGSEDANSIECCGEFDPASAAVCPVPAGTMIIHHGCTLHGAAENKSSTPRLAYILSYKTPPKSREDLGEFPWNNRVGRASRMERKHWLIRGGIFPELLRLARSDRGAHRHFLARISSFLQRLGRRD